MSRAWFAPALVVLALAPSLAAQAAPQISDSAGVKVVTNPEPQANVPRFKLAAKPRVSIGVVEGAPAYQLFRAGQAFVLRDGGIVIANQGTQELRFYDRTGKYVTTAGRKGEGPGEFTNLGLVAVFADDSLLTSDLQLKRYSVFDKTGKFVRSFQAPKEIGLIYQTPGVLSDGRIVALDAFIGPGHEANGRLRLPQKVSVMSADGTSVKAFGEFPGPEATVNPTMTLGVSFGRGLHIEARGDRIAVANDDAYSIRIYDGGGKLLQVVRQARRPVAVKPGDAEQAIPAAFRPDAPDSPFKGRVKPLLEQMYRYTTFPAFGARGNSTTSLRFTASGDLWVAEYQPPWENNSSWQAFDRTGKLIGRLEMPAGATLLDVGDGWLLVGVKDDLDVEHVLLYDLIKP